MKVLSLFDGISCAKVALKRAGLKVEKYYSSEIDPYTMQIANKNHKDIIQLGDVNKLKVKEKIDLLIGGSPCQDLSIAKANRKGLRGDRSGLFWEYVRILKEVKPKYFILENVASMSAIDRNIISKTLGVEPILINAALVSAQNRKRLFWTNIPNVTLPKDKHIFLKDILETNVDQKYFIEGYKTNWNSDKPIDETKEKYKTLRVGGDTPTVRVGKIGKGGQGDRIYSPEGKSVNLSANGGGRGAKTGLYMIQTPRGKNKGGPKKDGKTPTLSSSSWEHNNHLVDGRRIRKLTPTECERLQCLPDNYTEGLSNTQRYKALGNAFNVDVVAHILKHIPKAGDKSTR